MLFPGEFSRQIRRKVTFLKKIYKPSAMYISYEQIVSFFAVLERRSTVALQVAISDNWFFKLNCLHQKLFPILIAKFPLYVNKLQFYENIDHLVIQIS